MCKFSVVTILTLTIILLSISLIQCKIFCSITNERSMAHPEEIRFDSYQKSLKMMEDSPISLEKAFLSAMKEKNQHTAELKEAVVNPSLLGVRTKENEYFFIIDTKSKRRATREIGVYVSAINGSSRFVLNKNKCVAPSSALQYAPFITNRNEEKAAQIISDRFRTISQKYHQKNTHQNNRE